MSSPAVPDVVGTLSLGGYRSCRSEPDAAALDEELPLAIRVQESDDGDDDRCCDP